VISELDSRDWGWGRETEILPLPPMYMYLKLAMRKELRETELAYRLIENKFKL